jgi:hypothetical protein
VCFSTYFSLLQKSLTEAKAAVVALNTPDCCKMLGVSPLPSLWKSSSWLVLKDIQRDAFEVGVLVRSPEACNTG